MVGHNICFYGEIGLIIPKLSLLPLLILGPDYPLASEMSSFAYHYFSKIRNITEKKAQSKTYGRYRI